MALRGGEQFILMDAFIVDNYLGPLFLSSTAHTARRGGGIVGNVGDQTANRSGHDSRIIYITGFFFQ